jgi:hypothetical protein
MGLRSNFAEVCKHMGGSDQVMATSVLWTFFFSAEPPHFFRLAAEIDRILRNRAFAGEVVNLVVAAAMGR